MLYIKVIYIFFFLQSNNLVLHCAVTHFRKWCLSQESPIYHHLRPHIITTKVEHDAIKLPLTHRYAIEAGKQAVTISVDTRELAENFLLKMKVSVNPKELQTHLLLSPSILRKGLIFQLSHVICFGCGH